MRPKPGRRILRRPISGRDSGCAAAPNIKKRETKYVETLKQLFDLSGKVALVTGGARGLGKEMAEGLAEAGASLMLLARREQWLTPTIEEFRGRGFNCDGAVCDVSNPDDVQASVDRTIKAHGRIDILVNNAGVT